MKNIISTAIFMLLLVPMAVVAHNEPAQGQTEAASSQVTTQTANDTSSGSSNNEATQQQQSSGKKKDCGCGFNFNFFSSDYYDDNEYGD